MFNQFCLFKLEAALSELKALADDHGSYDALYQLIKEAEKEHLELHNEFPDLIPEENPDIDFLWEQYELALGVAV